MIKCNFSVAEICKPKSNYFVVKQMFAIQVLSLLLTFSSSIYTLGLINGVSF